MDKNTKTSKPNFQNLLNFKIKEEIPTDTLGRYKDLRLIGQGGLAKVYKAYDPKLDRPVAIKILRKGVASSASTKQRFKQEISVQSNLTIDGCAKIFDCGEEDGKIFCVMEFIDGKSLSALIKEDALTLSKKLEVVRQIIEIIKNLHSQGLEHRDIKPANIIVNAENQVKLLDFGLAKAIEEEKNIYTTAYGEFFGTPAYMSPEQTDHGLKSIPKFRSDIYALGVTIYELFTGHLPYELANLELNEITHVIKNDPPIPPKTYNGEIPDKLESIMLKILDKNPSERPTADELINLVKKIHLKAVGKNSRNKLLIIISSLAAIVVVVFAILFFCTQKNIKASIQYSSNNKDITLSKPHSTLKTPSKTGDILESHAIKENIQPLFGLKRIENKSGVSVYQNSIGMKFVSVKPGSFEMGLGISYLTNHKVTISKPYLMGLYEVTQTEYKKIMGLNPSEDIGPNKPVTNVSWDDAIEFCQKLTLIERKNGNIKDNESYRLPTEAEWEFAALGGISNLKFKYSGSNNLETVAWFEDNGESRVHTVGKKSPNSLGLHDMTGNVWEWCQDWYGPYPSKKIVDPTGPQSGTFHIYRGGSSFSSSESSLIANRSNDSQGDRVSYVGFRIVCSSI